MPIRPLPPLLVNQIAAGEVIERPASVVKELVENSLDAGATRVEIEIDGGGRDRIVVRDDGDGIADDELVLAVAPHATSKIAGADDLQAIATMGFRGEALASIASVSMLSIVSRPRDRAEAACIEAAGDRVEAPRPAGGPVGTAVTVGNLFFNTPVRRKFLPSAQTEGQRIVELVQTIAIAHPAVAFTLTMDVRSRLDLPAETDPRRRVLEVIGRDLAGEMLELRETHEGLSLWGMVGTPGVARGTVRHQRVYLNGRPIRDRSINHAIKEAYRGLIAPDRFPTVVMLLEMDPRQVDVNVHPAKSEVRFRHQQQVHTAVRSAIRRRLEQADLTAVLDMERVPGATTEPKPFGSGLAGGSIGAGSGGGHAPAAPVLRPWSGHGEARPAGFPVEQAREALADAGPMLAGPPAGEPVQAAVPVEALQVHDCYIVVPDEQGLVIIDQHALHERIMFEKLRARIDREKLESQRLLVPATVEVDQRMLERFEAVQPLLERIGVEAEPIGPRTLAVHAFTSLLFERKVDPVQFLADVLREAERLSLHDDSEAALHEVLDMMACKAAIKAGDRLTPAEITRLLEDRHLVDRSSRCPHGRPTTLRLTMQDLDRQFGRS
jgi:DNA mismatch repair protein MutL